MLTNPCSVPASLGLLHATSQCSNLCHGSSISRSNVISRAVAVPLLAPLSLGYTVRYKYRLDPWPSVVRTGSSTRLCLLRRPLRLDEEGGGREATWQ
jgi:hypothetical protein